MNQPRYAQWSQQSAAIWAEFAHELADNTGTSVPLEQKGGYDLHFSEDTLQATVEKYETLKQQLGGDYPFEVLGHNALRKEEPHIGPKVVGAILHHQDGHANPLKLLMALAADVRRLGGQVLVGKKVTDVTRPDGFRVTCSDGTRVHAGKVILSAGLGAAELGPKMGFKAPIRPQRGQVLITEKLPKLINRPSLIARQVDEGGIQIGATNEEVGTDDRVTQPGLSGLAAEAIAAYPALAKAQLVRSWGALRVLSPDGLPIYQQSAEMPGAYLVTCHSGITLAAAHARVLPDWLEGTDAAPDLEVFSEARFAIS
jgi:glycine/D-amino acid oxidase-like deaminating enzyme